MSMNQIGADQIKIYFKKDRKLRDNESDVMITIRGGGDFITIHYAMLAFYDLELNTVVLNSGCDLATGIDKVHPRGFYEITALNGKSRQSIENGTIPCSPIWFDAIEKIEGKRPEKKQKQVIQNQEERPLKAMMLASGNYERF